MLEKTAKLDTKLLSALQGQTGITCGGSFSIGQKSSATFCLQVNNSGDWVLGHSTQAVIGSHIP